MTIILAPPSHLVLPELHCVHSRFGVSIQKLCSLSRKSVSLPSPSVQIQPIREGSLLRDIFPHLTDHCIFDVCFTAGTVSLLHSKFLSLVQTANPQITLHYFVQTRPCTGQWGFKVEGDPHLYCRGAPPSGIRRTKQPLITDLQAKRA